MTAPTHELARLLVTLGAARFTVATDPDDAARLRFRPASLPPGFAALVLAHKPAILRLLRDGLHPDDDKARHVLIERLGVADELAMPTHPGSPAWLVAVAESIMSCCHKATVGVHCGHGAVDRGDCGGGAGEQ